MLQIFYLLSAPHRHLRVQRVQQHHWRIEREWLHIFLGVLVAYLFRVRKIGLIDDFRLLAIPCYKGKSAGLVNQVLRLHMSRSKELRTRSMKNGNMPHLTISSFDNSYSSGAIKWSFTSTFWSMCCMPIFSCSFRGDTKLLSQEHQEQRNEISYASKNKKLSNELKNQFQQILYMTVLSNIRYSFSTNQRSESM